MSLIFYNFTSAIIVDAPLRNHETFFWLSTFPFPILTLY